MYGMTNIKLKKLTLQYSYLLLEKDELSIICEKVEKEIRNYMKEKHPEEYNTIQKTANQDIKEPTIDESEDLDVTEEVKIPKIKNKDLKKLYRKIVEKTHPDKTGHNKCADDFSQAANAYSEGNLAKMLEIAGSLNIEISELSQESVQLLENNVETLTKEIIKIKNTHGWKWYKADSIQIKENIIKSIFRSKGIKI
jgi:hypothetical protein